MRIGRAFQKRYNPLLNMYDGEKVQATRLALLRLCDPLPLVVYHNCTHTQLDLQQPTFPASIMGEAAADQWYSKVLVGFFAALASLKTPFNWDTNKWFTDEKQSHSWRGEFCSHRRKRIMHQTLACAPLWFVQSMKPNIKKVILNKWWSLKAFTLVHT